MTTASEILRRVDEEILTSPERWTKGFYGLDEDGHSVGSGSEWACRFCLEGAVRRAAGHDVFAAQILDSVVRGAISDCFPKRIYGNAIIFNDYSDTTFEDVKRVLKRAIEIAEEREDS